MSPRLNPLRGASGEAIQRGRESRGYCREDGIRKFQEYFQRALALAPRQWKKAVERTWVYFPDDSVVMGIVPENDDDMKSRVLKFLATTTVIEPENPVAEKQYHTVGANETLYSIGRRYGVTVGKIRRLNRLGSSNVIYLGQKLRIDD